MHPPEGKQIFDQGAEEVLFGKLRQWHHELVMLAASLVISDESYKSQMAVFQEDHLRIRADFMEIEKRDRGRKQRERSYKTRKVVEASQEQERTGNTPPRSSRVSTLPPMRFGRRDALAVGSGSSAISSSRPQECKCDPSNPLHRGSEAQSLLHACGKWGWLARPVIL
jgi:hypothetical protein